MALKCLNELVDNYCINIKKNAFIAQKIENGISVAFLLGRLSNSEIISEAIFSIGELVKFTNDSIYKSLTFEHITLDKNVDFLQKSINILEYIQRLLELIGQSTFGEIGKWSTVVAIQVIKTIIKFLLLLKYKRGLQRKFPCLPLSLKQRVDAVEKKHISYRTINCNNPNSNYIELCSGRLMRKSNKIPNTKRSFILPLDYGSLKVYNRNNGKLPITILNKQQLIAESMHILNPIIHLVSMKIYGTNLWKPFFISLYIDVVSLSVLNIYKPDYCYPDHCLLNARIRGLYIYLFKSPVFDEFTKHIIVDSLINRTDRIPLMGQILKALISNIPNWQSRYFNVNGEFDSFFLK